MPRADLPARSAIDRIALIAQSVPAGSHVPRINELPSSGARASRTARDGRTGVLVFDNIAGTTNPSGVGNAHFVLSGSGGLVGLHGQGTAIVTPTPQGPFGVYTAQFSFGPSE